MTEDIKKEIFINMHSGEQRRDASPSIRGFLFQDLVTIEKLLEDKTIFTCSEYVEDVFAVSDSKIYIVQAKYYPSTSPVMNKIMRDLYYQYMRLRLYGYKGEINPVLSIHTKCSVNKPTVEAMKDYINYTRDGEQSAESDFHQWMHENVYGENKEVGYEAFFQKYATCESIEKFLRVLEINLITNNLEEYRKALGEKLDDNEFDNCSITNDEHRQNILIGLAIQYIQMTYNEMYTKRQKSVDNEDIYEQRKCGRDKFFDYLEQNLKTETNSQIAAYLRGSVIETWENIIANNSTLTCQQERVLQCIRDYTANWFYELGSTEIGQRQLLYTVSRNNESWFKKFESKKIHQRLLYVSEHKECIRSFLKYLWKIMLNIIAESTGMDETKILPEMFNPQNYIDIDESRYISTKFPEDSVECSVILSGTTAGSEWETYRNILDRMRKIKPEKWYFKNNLCTNMGFIHGAFNYDMDVTQIRENGDFSISFISGETYEIECMKCIKVDVGEWKTNEKCKENIFCKKCMEEEKL